ncbi:MAG: glycosyltransferase family 39 protein [Blastocatellia bacterium]|nr:glycosyltransferase family 39 protein [Blastocatellia bacterium]
MASNSLEYRKDRWTSPLFIALYLSITKLVVHLIFNRGYGYFRDELYFLACGEHLDWGYADHAPMIALVSYVSRALFGDSLSAIRLLPALAGACKVFLTGLFVKELGGSRLATLLACLCVVIAPIYLGIDNILSMNAFEPLFWMGCAYAVVLCINRQDPRYWLLFGVIAGLGLENKHSMLFFGFAIVVGVVLTNERRAFASKWFWLAAIAALLLFLPNIIWQYKHDWATLELLGNVKRSGKNVELSPISFLLQQLLIVFPLSAPVWLAGLFYLLFDKEGSRYRLLGISYLTTLLLMILLKGKNYYLAPAYPMLFAAGGIFFEKLPAKIISLAYVVVLLISGSLFAPFVLPILEVEKLLAYQKLVGFELPKTEVAHKGRLPQHFGDMFGWPEMVEAVARVYNKLPPEEREKALIFANNYGEAGAIDFFGRKYGLPKAISPHQNYFFWGSGEKPGDPMIVLQISKESALNYFEDVQEAETLKHPYAMSEEHFTILICRGMKQPLKEIWPKLKHWN